MSEISTTTGISLQAKLPLAWAAMQETSHANAELRTLSNIALLKALAAIDVVSVEHESHGEAAQKALERVEAKVDVVMLMLA